MKDFLDRSYTIDLLGGSQVSDPAWQIAGGPHAVIGISSPRLACHPKGQVCRRPWRQPPWWLLRLGRIRPACPSGRLISGDLPDRRARRARSPGCG